MKASERQPPISWLTQRTWILAQPIAVICEEMHWTAFEIAWHCRAWMQSRIQRAHAVVRRSLSMTFKKSILLLASILFSTPACAYQLVSIPPNGLYLIVCGNGHVFPWQTGGPDGTAVMNGVAIGLCQGTLVTNSHFNPRNVDVKKLLREQKPRKLSERTVEGRGR
jgi:hypothetical protein